MPKLNWNKISEIKHAVSQERVIICGIKMSLKNLKILETIKKLDKCDKRLEVLESQLVKVIETSNGE